jgi:hypothetical protein
MGCKKVFCGILSGLQENPPVYALNQKPASGHVKALLKKNNLYISGKFKNLSSEYLFSHIHLAVNVSGAKGPGANGPVVFTLNAKLSADKKSGCFKPCDNKFELTDQQVQDLNDGNLYVNVHSTNNPSGEIRAQLLPETKCCKQFIVLLSGANEVPPVTSTQGRGTLLATYKCGKLTISGSVNGLSGVPVAAHIHKAFEGQNGPVVFPLTFVTFLPNGANFLRADNSFPLTYEQYKILEAEGFYVNVHTALNPSGEIRGQIVLL